MARPMNDLKKCLTLLKKYEKQNNHFGLKELKTRYPLIYEEALAIHSKVKSNANRAAMELKNADF